MGWQRKQHEKNGKFKRIRSGEKDWTREEKKQIEAYKEKYEPDTQQRKAG